MKCESSQTQVWTQQQWKTANDTTGHLPSSTKKFQANFSAERCDPMALHSVSTAKGSTSIKTSDSSRLSRVDCSCTDQASTSMSCHFTVASLLPAFKTVFTSPATLSEEEGYAVAARRNKGWLQSRHVCTSEWRAHSGSLRLPFALQPFSPLRIMKHLF